jgi:hypothetical protein
MSPLRYELGFYIPEGDIFHSHRSENIKPYIALGWALWRRRYVSHVRYELGFYIYQKTSFFIVTDVKTSNLTWH